MSDIVARLRDLYLTHGMNYVQEAADEIERLRARLEIDAAHPYDGIATRDETIRMQDGEIECLRAEVEALRRDAERYRWLKARRVFKCDPKMDGAHQWHPVAVRLTGNTLDAAIDAVRGEMQ